ncbi:MAG TPA: sigma-54 dependent transcriptional regulator [Terriglobales bacterium]|nr:sigma-54 dependent transcriptional regulator [Terriglobales bacterium]
MTAAMVPSTLVPNPAHSFETPALLNVLIVEDDRPVREACRQAAASLGCRTTVTDSAEQALWLVGSQNIDVVLLGLTLPDSVRMQSLRQIKQKCRGVEVAIITANPAAQPAVEAMRAGACDCLIKPFGLGELRRILERAASQLKGRIASRQLIEQIKSNGFGGMVGRAPQMEKVYRITSKAAQSTHPVLILGESGTGKELVARAIHYSGPFRDKPFIPIDCGSLVPTLIESELFGHAKGAFTGAAQSKPGLLAIAEGGTVFLDEVGELSLDLQAKLLRALQEREVRPVGGTKALPINIRILAATNRDLEQAVSNGTFRRDLYFRLNVLNVRLPALREHREDVPLLATQLLERISRTCGRSYSLSEEAMQALIDHDWPGNVRELENCIERCCAINSGPIIHTVDLPSHVRAARHESLRTPTAPITRLADLEREAILAAITQLNGDKLMAARLLGIGKTTIYRKLKKYEVQ